MCFYLNMHANHKSLLINDEESLNKENLRIENYSIEFMENYNKLIKLNELIKSEITILDKLFKETENKMNNFFSNNPTIINNNNKKNILKEKLRNEVTKILDKLEDYLISINSIIRLSENIVKGIKKIENEEKINLFKKLSYISKINICNKKIKSIINKSMKNINITFIEKEPFILIKNYYFNGIQIPTDINFKNIHIDSMEVYWKVDDINKNNIDINKFKYKLELRKEKNENFMKVYEGNNQNCLIDELTKNTLYEIRICSLYNELNSSWSDIIKIRTQEKIESPLFNTSPYTIRLKVSGRDYYLVSHCYYGYDSIDGNNKRLNIHCEYSQPGKKWRFQKDENNLYSIISEETTLGMNNWRISIKGNIPVLSNSISSKFQIIKAETGNKFYIKEYKTGKYLFNNFERRDHLSFYLYASKKFDLSKEEEYSFYF